MMKRSLQIAALLSIAAVILAIYIFALPGFASAQKVAKTPAPGKPDISRNQVGYAADVVQVTDGFGYEINTAASAWINASGGVLVDFDGNDDEFSEPIPIGFAFPFYENTYSNLYVSTNGFLTFGEGSKAYENRNIPRDTDPNNYIAPFWDDLKLQTDGPNTSSVYYQTGTDSKGKYIVLEWYRITRFDTYDDILTFEVILHENGDITIQYDRLDGTLNNATVGIEDDKGVNGVAYVFNNSTGLSTGTAIHFMRPDPSARSKIYPLYRGSFSYAGNANFWFTVCNSGELGTDTYNLEMSPYDSSWRVTLYNEAGMVLGDTNGDGKIDTGALTQGEEARVRVVIESPDIAQIGDEIQVVLNVASVKNATKTAQASFTVAIPTPFAQTVLTGSAMKLHMVWRENQITALAAPTQFTGSNLAIQRLPSGNYMYSWEQNISIDPNFHADLRYTILSDVGGVILDTKDLTNNSVVSIRTEDRYLASSVTDDGLVGTVWTRREKMYFEADSENKNRYNVFFAVLDQFGNIVIPETNITQNLEWRGTVDLNVPTFLNPRITATQNNRFVIAWERNVLETTDEADNGSIDIEYAVYTDSGTLVKSPTILTNSQPKVIDFVSPAMADMSGYQALLTFVVSDEVLGTNTLSYIVLDSNGNIVKTQTAIPGSTGASLHDSIRLSNSSMLVAWPSSTTDQVGFCLLDASSGNISLAAQYLTPPNLRSPDSVSVARDQDGHGIITWRDQSQGEYLYYALLDPTGVILTPAITFLSNNENGTTITTNGYGYGLASYEGSWRVSLPLTLR